MRDYDLATTLTACRHFLISKEVPFGLHPTLEARVLEIGIILDVIIFFFFNFVS